jgi:hypothetical protein
VQRDPIQAVHVNADGATVQLQWPELHLEVAYPGAADFCLLNMASTRQQSGFERSRATPVTLILQYTYLCHLR